MPKSVRLQDDRAQVEMEDAGGRNPMYDSIASTKSVRVRRSSLTGSSMKGLMSSKFANRALNAAVAVGHVSNDVGYMDDEIIGGPSEKAYDSERKSGRELELAPPPAEPTPVAPPKPKPSGPRKPDPTPITERDGGYFYYHVNFILTFGTHVLLVCLVATGELWAPDEAWVARIAAKNNDTDTDDYDEDLEKYVARLAWTADVASTAVLSTLLQLCFVRQEKFFIQPLYFFVCRTPHWVPLFIRTKMARWVYSLGGFHSGSGCAMVVWLVLLAVYKSLAYSRNRGLGPGTGMDQLLALGEGTKALALNIAIIGCLVVVSFTALWHRGARHNLFEAMHRWVGWSALALTWALVLAVRPPGGEPNPTDLWLLSMATFFIFFPWLSVRRVKVACTVPSSHCICLEFGDAAPECGTFGRISHTVLGEYHTFATVTKSATPYTDETCKHTMIIAGAGDWTKSLIMNPPEHMWVRSIRTPGFMATVKMFKSTILVHTGAGIAPGLPFIYQSWPNVKHVLWTTRNPRETFGDEITDMVLSMPSVLMWDTTERGRPNIEELTIEAWREHRTEAVHIVANEPITMKVVSALRKVGVPCFGAIWDS